MWFRRIIPKSRFLGGWIHQPTTEAPKVAGSHHGLQFCPCCDCGGFLPPASGQGFGDIVWVGDEITIPGMWIVCTKWFNYSIQTIESKSQTFFCDDVFGHPQLQAAVGSSGFIWFLRPTDLDETLRIFLDALGFFRDGCSFILGSCLQQGGFRDSDDKHPDASQCLSLCETFQGQFCQLALHIIYLARISHRENSIWYFHSNIQLVAFITHGWEGDPSINQSVNVRGLCSEAKCDWTWIFTTWRVCGDLWPIETNLMSEAVFWLHKTQRCEPCIFGIFTE